MSTETETAGVLRIYEVGYHIIPTVKEEDVEAQVGAIRTEIEKVDGSFISEGAPSLLKLAYPMTTREGEKYLEHDRAYFGWIKFEASPEAAEALNKALIANPAIVRCLVFKTLREDTRAKMKAPTLREVKRTDTIKAARRVEEGATKEAPISEADLDKALEELTVE